MVVRLSQAIPQTSSRPFSGGFDGFGFLGCFGALGLRPFLGCSGMLFGALTKHFEAVWSCFGSLFPRLFPDLFGAVLLPKAVWACLEALPLLDCLLLGCLQATLGMLLGRAGTCAQHQLV